jgi:hypothetical protein
MNSAIYLEDVFADLLIEYKAPFFVKIVAFSLSDLNIKMLITADI